MAKRIEETETYLLLWQAFQNMSEGSLDPDVPPHVAAVMGATAGFVAAAMAMLKQNPAAVELALDTVMLSELEGRLKQALRRDPQEVN